jgi:hypothetical protein
LGPTKLEERCIPRFISIRGVSEGNWERKRRAWQGDGDRERGRPHKKMKTADTANDDAMDEESVLGSGRGEKDVSA